MILGDDDIEDLQASCSRESTLWIYLHRCAKLGPRSIWMKQKNSVLEEQTRTLCEKAVRHRMGKADIDHSPIKTPQIRERPSDSALKCIFDMIDVLTNNHQEIFSDIIYKLNVPIQNERALCRAYSDFAESLFAKTISWPLIASLLAFSGGLAIECIRNGRSILVRRICDWATIFVVMRLKNWIKQNGGWDGILNCLQSDEEPDIKEESPAVYKLFKKSPRMYSHSSLIFLLIIFFLLAFIGYTTTLHVAACRPDGTAAKGFGNAEM